MVELLSLRVDPKSAKFLVIDVQNDVCDDNSAFAQSEYEPDKKRDVKPMQEAVENGILPFLGTARENMLKVGFVQSIYQLGQFPNVSYKWLTIDPELEDPEWRIKIYRDMPDPWEPVFKKDTQETFTYHGKDNGLADWLKGTKDVFVSGFTTDGCVKRGVYALFERGYKPIVLGDCVATSGYKINTAHILTLNEFRDHEIIRLVNSKNVEFDLI